MYILLLNNNNYILFFNKVYIHQEHQSSQIHKNLTPHQIKIDFDSKIIRNCSTDNLH